MKVLLSYLLVIILLMACEPDIGISSNTTNQDVNYSARDSSEINTDTNAIKLKILEPYKITYFVYDDSLKEDIKYTNYTARISCMINLNNDDWLDCFLTENNMRGPEYGFFIDGKTGEACSIDYDVWSRPGIEIEYKIIDIDCDDNQEELLIRYASGGTLGSYYNCQVYRYDKEVNCVKLIFEKPISIYNWEGSTEKEVEVNYIDINYNSDSCINEIVVQEGKINKRKKAYNLEIEPKKNGMTWIYKFDKQKNEFVLRD